MGAVAHHTYVAGRQLFFYWNPENAAFCQGAGSKVLRHKSDAKVMGSHRGDQIRSGWFHIRFQRKAAGEKLLLQEISGGSALSKADQRIVGKLCKAHNLSAEVFKAASRNDDIPEGRERSHRKTVQMFQRRDDDGKVDSAFL